MALKSALANSEGERGLKHELRMYEVASAAARHSAAACDCRRAGAERYGSWVGYPVVHCFVCLPCLDALY